MGALQSIPGEMYEAAELDGASTFMSFIYITMPSITNVIVVTVMLSTIWTTNGIDFIYTLTNGGPGGATETFPLLAIAQGLPSALRKPSSSRAPGRSRIAPAAASRL